MAVTYEQARADHEYLWESFGPADDMSGGYVDQDDLAKLMKSPTKATAKDVYSSQIQYFLQVGPDRMGSKYAFDWRDDPVVREIAERHGFDIIDDPDIDNEA